MIEYLREIMLGICFWLIINLELIFIGGLLTCSFFWCSLFTEKIFPISVITYTDGV